MDSIAVNFVSPTWWITVVIGGIVLHVVARRADKLLDACFGGITEFWRRRSQRRIQESEARLALMRNNERWFHFYLAQVQFFHQQATDCLIFVGIFVGLYVGMLVEHGAKVELMSPVHLAALKAAYMCAMALAFMLGFVRLSYSASVRRDIRTYLAESVLPPTAAPIAELT